jgi:5-methylcytosine-specific restriction protein A
VGDSKRKRKLAPRWLSAHKRGYTGRWQRQREIFLAYNPLCVECLSEGRYTPAAIVDHIKPHRGNKELFWDKSNWQSLCAKHHNAKTARGL